MITFNWATYIWGVNNGRVVETSLGYFINPLVTVLMGVFILGERLRPLQWVAMGIAATAVVVLTVDYGRLPWVALVLAFSFGTLRAVQEDRERRRGREPHLRDRRDRAVRRWRTSSGSAPQGQANFAAHGAGHALLLSSTGIVTAIPLICFGAAAIRVSMVTLGLLQYLAPILQFALGVLWFHEDMPAGRWVGFALVWVALIDVHRRGGQPPPPPAPPHRRGVDRRLISAPFRSRRAGRWLNHHQRVS